MKKILGISLCALFAVSAANAEIASTEWVSQQVGAIDTSGITTNANNISALAERVTENENDIATNTNAITTNTGAILQNATKTNTNTTNIATNTQAIADINADIADMTANVTGSHFIQGVSQANGKVTPTGKNFETTLLATTNDNAPTSKAVADYVAGQVSGLEVDALEERVTANATNIQTNKTNIQTNTGNITTLEGRIDGHDTSIAGLTEQVGINEGKINTLDEDIQAMDLTATTGDYVKVVSQSNGTVQATGASFDTSVSDTSNNAPTSKAVAGYVATNAVQTVVAGDTNGTIKVDDTPVAVTGLQAMAYKAAVTNTDITDETITNADISPTAAILSSKISFPREQANALDSGITSTLVDKITANESAIGENTTNIASNATNITNMGTQVTTNKTNITDLQGRMTTAEGKITNNTTAIKRILEAEGATTCDDTEAGCTLVLSSAGLKWEKVTRAAQ